VYHCGYYTGSGEDGVDRTDVLVAAVVDGEDDGDDDVEGDADAGGGSCRDMRWRDAQGKSRWTR